MYEFLITIFVHNIGQAYFTFHNETIIFLSKITLDKTNINPYPYQSLTNSIHSHTLGFIRELLLREMFTTSNLYV
jgi:hypothetical protein